MRTHPLYQLPTRPVRLSTISPLPTSPILTPLPQTQAQQVPLRLPQRRLRREERLLHLPRVREGVPPRRSKVPQLYPREVHRVRARPAPQDRAATRPRSAPPRRGEARGAGTQLRRGKVIARPARYPTLKSPVACMLTGYIAYCTGSSKRPVTCRAPRLDIQSTASVRDDPFSQYTTTYTDARSLTTNPRKTPQTRENQIFKPSRLSRL